MGQMAATESVETLKDRIPQQIGIIPELKDVTLKGVTLINNELGRGAYGSVFTVKYQGVVCAAKKIHPILMENVSNEERQKVKDDFIRECLCCSNIRHPNIVQFVGVYYPSDYLGLPIMVMELMDSSLTKFVEKNKSQIAIQTKISVLYDVSLGLTFLHTHRPQILHRDLSSNNIMLTSELVAKIGDLGVAKVIQADNKQTKSRLTAVPGTQHFMPPEALDENNPVYSTPIDVFSYGCIILHVFSEEWPAPSGIKKMDPVTNKPLALTEVERRQQYLDQITGKVGELRKMAEGCLDDDPDKRPPIQMVPNFIAPLKVYRLGYCIHI